MNKKSKPIEDISRGIEIEFNALRNEVLKRIEIREHISQITLGLAGVFQSVGLANPVIAFIYPTLSFFLAVGWAQNDIRIRQLGNYIRNKLEPALPGLAWESHRKNIEEQTRTSLWHFVILSHGGIFVTTQIMAIGIGIFKFTYTLIEQVLLGVDLLSILLTFILLEYVRRASDRIDFRSEKTNPKRRMP